MERTCLTGDLSRYEPIFLLVVSPGEGVDLVKLRPLRTTIPANPLDHRPCRLARSARSIVISESWHSKSRRGGVLRTSMKPCRQFCAMLCVVTADGYLMAVVWQESRAASDETLPRPWKLSHSTESISTPRCNLAPSCGLVVSSARTSGCVKQSSTDAHVSPMRDVSMSYPHGFPVGQILSSAWRTSPYSIPRVCDRSKSQTSRVQSLPASSICSLYISTMSDGPLISQNLLHTGLGIDMVQRSCSYEELFA
nr:hypothetical protein CFP56_19528 [Quercus suber]